MRYRTIGTDPATRREVSVLSLGAMLMGSRTGEATSFAILDRFVEAGGTFIDTSGNYAFWAPLGVDGGAGTGAGSCFWAAGLRGTAVLPHVPAAAGGFAGVAVAGRRAGGGGSGSAQLLAAWVPALTRKQTFVTPAPPVPNHKSIVGGRAPAARPRST
jgi:hypothetical protein